MATSRADQFVSTTASLANRMILPLVVDSAAAAVAVAVAALEDVEVAAVVAVTLAVVADEVVVEVLAVAVAAATTVAASETSLAPRSPSKLIALDQWCCIDY